MFPSWLRWLVVAIVLAIAARWLVNRPSGAGPSGAPETTMLTPDQQAGIEAWLHCEECVDGELDFVVNTVGFAAADLLREALAGAHEDVRARIEATLGAEWARVEGSAVDSAEFVERFAANYRATVRKRAAVAMGALGDTAGLREAMESSDFDGYRPDVRAAIAEARFAAGAPGFAPPDPDRVVVRPSPDTVFRGTTGMLEGIVLDADGNPLSRPLTWSSSAPGTASVVGVEAGRGDVTGHAVGTVTITASTGAVSGTAAVVVLDPPPASDYRIRIVSGDAQRDTVGLALDEPLVVRVTDAHGTELSGVTVSWSVTRGDATPAADTSTSDATGTATLDLDLGTTPGPVWVEAVAGSAGPVIFQLVALPR